MSGKTYQTEKTAQGQQALVPGIVPITERDRLQCLADAPLTAPKPQKPLNIGLFDEGARNQLDLFA